MALLYNTLRGRQLSTLLSIGDKSYNFSTAMDAFAQIVLNNLET